MDDLIRNLTTLGLKEYEARVYAALVGLGEGNARQIHEASGVPRPRVYDIAEALANRGFIRVQRGNPHLYIPVEPAVLVNQLKSGMEQAAADAVHDLDTLSLDARSKNAPIWYVQGDWSIHRHAESLVMGALCELAVVCMDYEQIGDYARPIADAAERCPVSILFPNGKRGVARTLGNAALYTPRAFCDFFQEHIFATVFSGPVSVDGSSFLLEYIFIADDRVCMLVYAENGIRNAVVITLPFITRIQKQFVSRMIAHAEPLETSAKVEQKDA